MKEIDGFWISKALFFAIWGILIARFLPKIIHHRLLKEMEVVRSYDGKYKQLFKYSFYLVLSVAVVANIALLCFLLFSDYFLNMTLFTSILILPIFFWKLWLVDRSIIK
jgi:hypothetical protein